MSDDREQRWRKYLEDIGDGKSEALGHLYRETVSILYGMALRMLANQADADEVVLEVYEQVWRSAATYDASRSRVLWWLSMLTRSRALDRLRSAKRRESVEEPVTETMDFSALDRLQDENVWVAQEQERVHEALKDLSPEQRQAVELAFFSELSHTEIADKLGIPLGTIKTRIRTALRRLRDSLEKLTDDRWEQTA